MSNNVWNSIGTDFLSYNFAEFEVGFFILDGSDNKIAELTTGITWQAAAGAINSISLALNPASVKA